MRDALIVVSELVRPGSDFSALGHFPDVDCSESVNVRDALEIVEHMYLEGRRDIGSPQFFINGPSVSVSGQPVSFTFSTSLTGPFQYQVDWNGDGNIDDFFASESSRITVAHEYLNNRSYSVRTYVSGTAAIRQSTPAGESESTRYGSATAI